VEREEVEVKLFFAYRIHDRRLQVRRSGNANPNSNEQQRRREADEAVVVACIGLCISNCGRASSRSLWFLWWRGGRDPMTSVRLSACDSCEDHTSSGHEQRSREKDEDFDEWLLEKCV
jgi:hypothetical protein